MFSRLAALAIVGMIGVTAPATCSGQTGETWQEFQSPDGSFVLKVPSPPREDRVTTPDPWFAAGSLATFIYSIQGPGHGWAFICDYTDLASATGTVAALVEPDRVLKQQRDAFLATIGGPDGKVTVDREEVGAFLGDFRGREMRVTTTFNNGTAAGRARVFLVGSRIYLLGFTYIPALIEPSTAEAIGDRLFRGFSLTPRGDPRRRPGM